MKSFVAFITLVLAGCSGVLLSGCQKNEIVAEPESTETSFKIPAWNFSTRHFFIDTSYIAGYEALQLEEPPLLVNPQSSVSWIQVWVERKGALPDPGERTFTARISLPPYDEATYDGLRSSRPIDGSIENGQFVMLAPWQYDFDPFAGTLFLLEPLALDSLAVAVAYETADSRVYGENSSMLRDTAADPHAPLLLKLVKPRHLYTKGPQFPIAWQLMLKNSYSLGYGQIAQTGFFLDVVASGPNVGWGNRILDIPLLQVLGLDRYHASGIPGPDGKFDQFHRTIIDRVNGEITFPYLRPFDQGIREYFASVGKPLPPSTPFAIPAIYDELAESAKAHGGADYQIAGHFLY